MKLGLAGLTAAFCGWLGVDLYLWIAGAFNSSAGLGWTATAAAAAGITAALAIIAHEMRSYLALKSVEANAHVVAGQWETLRPADMLHAIGRETWTQDFIHGATIAKRHRVDAGQFAQPRLFPVGERQHSKHTRHVFRSR